MWCWLGTAFAAGVGLADVAPVELSLPTDQTEPVAHIAVPGPWRLVGVQQGVRSYEAPLPVRPRALFFTSAPEGMVLRKGANKVRYGGAVTDGAHAATWIFTAHSVTVRVAPEVPPPGADTYTLEWKQAADREASLHLPADAAWTDVVRSAQVDDLSRRGLYLPAPARVAWDLDLPEGAVLSFSAGILPPEAEDGTRSDGADLELRVDGEVVATRRLSAFTQVEVPLTKVGRARVELRTADADPTRDHVFVGEPQVWVPAEKPRRLLMVFIDTLRRDHVGLYGATRGASPHIDALGGAGVVFDDARSVAPWTLPSSRTVLTGLQPERWREAPTLPARLSREGWATGAFVGNVYLSSNFDMADGWGEHGVVNWPSATLEVERGLDFLARHPRQDAALMVHFMDMHLPYQEPWSYQDLYVDHELPGLGRSFVRSALLRYAKGKEDEVRDYLLGRYDQNLRYIDDQLGRLLAAAGDDATVLLFADHGEEFFDHGDLEHGHSLYDELLRVPLILRSPGLSPRRVLPPVSLLDVAPTLLDLLGMPHEGLDGHSLLAAARGEPDPTLDHRPLGFGRPLYGNRAWGALLDGTKYTTTQGAEHVYDLVDDPKEKKDLRADVDPAPLRAAMARAVGARVHQAFRITASGPIRPPGATLHVPGGIAEVWIGDDPTQKSKATVDRVDAETVRLSFTGTGYVQREIFVVPVAPPEEAAAGTTLQAGKSEPVTLAVRPLGTESLPLAKVAAQGKNVTVTWAITPLPTGEALVGFDPEMEAALRALGYVEPEEGSDEKP